MIPNDLTSGGLSGAKPASLERAELLAATLLRNAVKRPARWSRANCTMRWALSTPAIGIAFSAISPANFSPTKRRCAPRRNAISPTARWTPRPRSRRPPTRPGRNCCGE